MSEIDLQPFCSTEEYRAYLMKPWTRGGFTWATNGHILVRVTARSDIEDNPDAPNVQRVMACHDGAEFAALPVVNWPDEPIRKKCETCGGDGKDPEFEGVECFACEGDGLGPEPQTSILVRGVHFQVKYIRMIEGLPGAEFAVNPNPSLEKYKETMPSAFRFRGGLGALMPMRRGQENHLGDIESLGRAA